MDLPCDCTSETPAPEQPSGKINKAAFKLFKKRKTGSTLPSIFGVKNKGDGKSSGPAGMVKSRTHDGLAEAVSVLESGRKEEEAAAQDDGVADRGRGLRGDQSNPGPPKATEGGSVSSLANNNNSSVAKSHSFFSLLKKNGRSENGKGGEPSDASKAAGKQKKGLRGIFSSMRWHKRDKRGGSKDGGEKEAACSQSPGSLILPGSLTASLECVKEETPRAACKPDSPTSKETPPDPAGELGGGEEVPATTTTTTTTTITTTTTTTSTTTTTTDRASAARISREAQSPGGPYDKTTQAEDSRGYHHHHPRTEKSWTPPEAEADEVHSAQETPSTGCGDIIADQEEEADSSCDKHIPGSGNTVLSKKNPNVIAYQGGGEEMASPDGVGDTYLQEFWDMLSQTEDQREARPQDRVAKGAIAQEAKAVPPDTSKDARRVEVAKDVSSIKRRRLNRIPVDLYPKEDPKHPEKEQQEGVPNSDEGYCESTTPGPEEDRVNSSKKASVPPESDSGDALYDLYTEPNGSPAPPPAGQENTCLSRLKPVAPGTITCPLRTPGSLLKDSKIPISVKHLTNLPSSHPVGPQPPSRSDMPRTKIPVSKVLVRRVSNRGLAGTTMRAAACHDSAKKL